MVLKPINTYTTDPSLYFKVQKNKLSSYSTFYWFFDFLIRLAHQEDSSENERHYLKPHTIRNPSEAANDSVLYKDGDGAQFYVVMKFVRNYLV